MSKKLIGLLILLGAFIMSKKSVSSAGSEIISRMAEAMKNFEGWFTGSRSYRNNSPGNIRWAGVVPSDGSGGGVLAGAIGKDDTNHLIYRSFADGWNALLFQIKIALTGESSVYSPQMSFYEFFQHYAEGNQAQYAESVAAALGVSPDSRIGDLIS